MENIRINQCRLSQIAWEQIFEQATPWRHTVFDALMQRTSQLDSLRALATYNTGSITTSAIWSLFSATLFFRPQRIAEVGTFIGKSTFSMAAAIDQYRPEGGEIYTCDFSNNIPLGLESATAIVQYPLKSSTDMLADLVQQRLSIDLLLLDGRLQPEDFALLSNLLHRDSVILLDDFEGVEKGVTNAASLMASLKSSHALLYPPARELLQAHGLRDSCTLAMIVPLSLVHFTAQ